MNVSARKFYSLGSEGVKGRQQKEASWAPLWTARHHTRQHFAGFPAQCVRKGRLKVAKTAGVTARGGVGVGVGGKG